jgi:hypothetical protein
MDEGAAAAILSGRLPRPQRRAGARLRSRSSSGQAVKIAVVFILENSCDVPTTRSLEAWLTFKRKKMQPDHPLFLQEFLLQS